eukprot:scaffold16979_cov21-Tisochrysis_lutea.AAC.8
MRKVPEGVLATEKVHDGNHDDLEDHWQNYNCIAPLSVAMPTACSCYAPMSLVRPTSKDTSEACAIASSPQPSALGPEVQTAGAQEELIAQLFLPASRYVLISTAGVVELEKR